jgi:hypothetical protein
MKNLLICALLLSSCYSPRVMNCYIDKAYKKQPMLIQQKMEIYHHCNWLTIKMTPADYQLADSLFNANSCKK